MSNIKELSRFPKLLKKLIEKKYIEQNQEKLVVNPKFKKMLYKYHGTNVNNIPKQNVENSLFIVNNCGTIYITEHSRRFLQKNI